MDKKYILFDLDGTLTDPKVGITNSVKYALKSYGIEEENMELLCKYIGPPLKDGFMDYHNLSSEDALTAIEKYREYFSETGIFENIVYEGIKELLIKLKQKDKTLIVATSKPTVFAIRILEHFGLKDYFTDICGSEIDGTRVKKGEVIAYALEKNGITDLDQVVMIGDRMHDMIGAKENDIESIGVLYGYGNWDELDESGADRIISRVSRLYDYFGVLSI